MFFSDCLSFCLLSFTDGEVRICSSFDATQLFFNHSCKGELTNRLSGGNLASNIPPNDVLVTSIEDIYLKKQLGEYWVAGCIVDVKSVADWYYISCKSNSCKRKVTECGGMLFCMYIDHYVFLFEKTYKI
nr:replication protein A 70 kDa DNA-binding subunit B-like [Ipomoea batatas]